MKLQREQLEVYKERLLDTYDLEELCDVLDISITDLVNRFEDKVLEHAEAEGWCSEVVDGCEGPEEYDEEYPT